MLIVGIDVGKSGSLAILDTQISFIDYSKYGLKGYINKLKEIKPDIVIVELVHSMPGQGVKAMFSFGQRLGELEGMLQALEIPYELVTPKVWQKTLGVKTKCTKQDIYKAISKLYPNTELFGPKGGLLDGRCDSLSLAHYGRIKYKGCL